MVGILALRRAAIPGVAARHLCAAASGGSARDARDPRLQVSSDADVAKLGGAIAARVREFGRATMRSIGSKAAFRGVKAVVNASEYLREDQGADKGQVLAVRVSESPEEHEPVGGGDPVRRTVMTMEARLRPSPSPDLRATNLIVGAQTNAGRAAAAVAHSLRPEGGAAAVRALGATAVHQSLIATALAQKYLDNDDKGVKCAVVPSFESSKEPGEGPKRQLVLQIIRVEGS
eukprot:gnl/TRDRNA2_/TRDRNA2_175807_c7_seq2.p1 gnl/TRDRNA2_/TRDRNA2_175807_c7~~gnl/TRDRNA2_/TRDRNA2_175807_c7_seq2.p1  ORF type:complete len:232 (+),score=39.35 gnl/TRDRNA2_/TRDRNA2_175807_c7_seq2:92-787(+)